MHCSRHFVFWPSLHRETLPCSLIFSRKSRVVINFGESAKTRERERLLRSWSVCGCVIKEVDEYKHLGILRTVGNSTVVRTGERATSARSAFFALNSVGTRFGCLHPLTSLRLYRSLCLPIMLYGSELWFLTKTELLFLERVHRKILRTIQGLPIRCSSSSLTSNKQKIRKIKIG